MTQKELAERTGIRPPTVSAICVGSVKHLHVDALEKICDAPQIKAIYAEDNYSGNDGRMPIEVLDVEELTYYGAYGPYIPSLTSTKEIYLDK